jgi:hypothetical protein
MRRGNASEALGRGRDGYRRANGCSQLVIWDRTLAKVLARKRGLTLAWFPETEDRLHKGLAAEKEANVQRE